MVLLSLQHFLPTKVSLNVTLPDWSFLLNIGYTVLLIKWNLNEWNLGSWLHSTFFAPRNIIWAILWQHLIAVKMYLMSQMKACIPHKLWICSCTSNSCEGSNNFPGSQVCACGCYCCLTDPTMKFLVLSLDVSVEVLTDNIIGAWTCLWE